MLVALVALFCLYYLLLLLLVRGWRRALKPAAPTLHGPDERVTVIIAARNEESTIRMLLEDLDRQEGSNFEVIVVDDHSGDDTAGVVNTLAGRVGYPLHLLHPGSLHGKKNALSAGVLQARGSVIITTDADCRVGREWVARLRECFQNPDIKFVSAGVRIRQEGNLRTALQAAEFVSLVGTGGASIGYGYSVMCNGANMAFRKETFLAVDGYEGNRHIASGDDEFLMNKIRLRYPEGIRFCSNPASVVETGAVSWPAFISQRIRWAGKWKYHGAAASPAIAIFIFFFHLSLLTLLPATCATVNLEIPLTLLMVKAVLEYWFLSPVGRFLGLRWDWPSFVFLQVVYPLYAASIGILANVSVTTWKGRKIKPRAKEMRSRLAENR